jgi:hypothetical protein
MFNAFLLSKPQSMIPHDDGFWQRICLQLHHASEHAGLLINPAVYDNVVQLQNCKERLFFMDKPVLVVMAAGMGSRYGGLKQMDPVDDAGHIIMDFSLYDAAEAGFLHALHAAEAGLLGRVDLRRDKHSPVRAEQVELDAGSGALNDEFPHDSYLRNICIHVSYAAVGGLLPLL